MHLHVSCVYETLDPKNVLTIKCIPGDRLAEHSTDLGELAEAIYGDVSSAEFNERFVPPGGRVPGIGPVRVLNFGRFLSHAPECLVIVHEDGKCCGFIVIANVPFLNSVGFGIHPGFAGRGIMSEAWRRFLEQCECARFPLHAYTSVRNAPANGFLVKCGFMLVEDDVDFMGEPSNKYVLRDERNPQHVRMGLST